MSVFTTVSHEACAALLKNYDVGALVELKGIDAGVENTNYFVTTERAKLVLTLFEHHDHDEVNDFVALARHLGAKGMAVPAPLPDVNGRWLHTVENKPAVLCTRYQGEHVRTPSADDCYAIGAWLARMHLNATDLQPIRKDTRGFDWQCAARTTFDYLLDDGERALMDDELAFQTAQLPRWRALPHGWGHADLFHDNALMQHDENGASVGAVLDFYNACECAWVYDLAVVANDWCCKDFGTLEPERSDALLDGYASVRPLSSPELEFWPVALRRAALRFWLSRLLSKHQQQQKGLQALENLDPNALKACLMLRRDA